MSEWSAGAGAVLAVEGSVPTLTVALMMGLAVVGGHLARRHRQPAIIGEIVAGLVISPAVLDALRPDLAQRVVPPGARPVLDGVSQVALVIYLFTVGYELDRKQMRRQGRSVAAVATGSVLLPVTAGMALVAFGLRPGPAAGAASTLLVAALLSVTAVPVLARLLDDHHLADTPTGRIALASAVIVDVVAWLLLAVALATDGDQRPGWHEAAALAALAAVMVAMRRSERWAATRRSRSDAIVPGLTLAFTFLGASLSAAAGLHVAFGALACGIAAPKDRGGRPRTDIEVPLRHISAVFLPLFFVVAGSRVDLAALRPVDAALLVLVTTVAVLTKVAGATLAGRAVGMEARQARTVGVLMSTRGVTELVAVEIGRAAGLLDDRHHAIFVLMALLTTALTTPFLRLLDRSPASVTVEDSTISSGPDIISGTDRLVGRRSS